MTKQYLLYSVTGLLQVSGLVFSLMASKEYSSYRKIPVCRPSDSFRYPSSLQDVINIVQEAIARRTTVKAFGSRHSQTDMICTDGIPVETLGLNWMRLNPDNTVTFGAGVLLHEATSFLRMQGRAFKTTPAFGNITIGGAIGTGAHGSTLIHKSSISSQVVSMTVVDGKGQTQEIHNPEDLQAFRIHLGLLGFIVSITLNTHPLYKTRAWNYVAHESVLLDSSIPLWLQQVDQMSIYWFPSAEKVVVANWTIVDVQTPGEAFTYDHVPSSSSLFNLLVVPTLDLIQGLAASSCTVLAALGYSILFAVERYTLSTLITNTPLFVPIYTDDGRTVKNPAVGYYDLMFAPTCREDGQTDLQCPWAHPGLNLTILDNELSIALQDLPAFILRVKDILKKVPGAFPTQGILMRFSASSDIYMSTSYGRDTVHFEWYVPNRKNTYDTPSASLAAFQTISQVAVKDFGARPHWGKNGLVYHSKDFLKLKLDANARLKFIHKMQQFDPAGVFMNKFGRRLLGIDTRTDTDEKVTRCAMLDYCICSRSSDCGPTQVCGWVPGYWNHPVCRTPNDELVLKQLHKADSPIDFISWILETIPALVLTAKSKCLVSVGNVAKTLGRNLQSIHGLGVF